VFLDAGWPAHEIGAAGEGGPLRHQRRSQAGFYAFLWPNFTLNIYPGPGNVSLNLFLPVDTHRTLAIYEYCFAESVPEREIEDFTRFIDQVQEEDVVLCESVQRGLRSGFFDRGRLMRSERALAHFQKLVHRFLADGPDETDKADESNEADV
jgi:choline monooxygenase